MMGLFNTPSGNNILSLFSVVGDGSKSADSSADLLAMLGAADVMTRYGIKDVRAARDVIQGAGGRKIGGRWQVRLERLLAWEDKPDAADPLAVGAATINHVAPANARNQDVPDDLPPGWFRDKEPA